MLPVPAQHRLYRHVPGNDELPPEERNPVDLDYYKFTGEYIHAEPTLDVFWAEEDYNPTYPCVALDLGPTSIPRYEGQTLDEWVRRWARPDDPTIAYEEVKGAKLRDTLTITVMVRDDYRVSEGEGTPPGAVIPRSAFAKELAQDIFAAFRFESDYLNEPGVTRDGEPLWSDTGSDGDGSDGGDESVVDAEDWAVPMNIEPVSGRGVMRNPAMVDEQHVDRYNMQFRVEYELTHSVLVDAVQAIEYDVTIDEKTVTRERVGTAGPVVAEAVFPEAASGE